MRLCRMSFGVGFSEMLVHINLLLNFFIRLAGKAPSKEMRLARPGQDSENLFGLPQSFHTVDGGDVWNQRNKGINYQPQLVQDFSHQQYFQSLALQQKPRDTIIKPSLVNCFLLWATLFWRSNCCRLRDQNTNPYCWWLKSHSQPPGMVLKPCKYWDKLPTSTGAGFLNHQQYYSYCTSTSTPITKTTASTMSRTTKPGGGKHLHTRKW